MKKVDVFSFSISLILNLLLLLFIFVSRTPQVTGKIRVGLVADGKKNVSYEGKKEVEKKEIPEPKKPESPAPTPQPEVVPEVRKLDLSNLQIAAPVISNTAGRKVVDAKKITSSTPQQSQAVRDALEAPIKTLGAAAGVPSGYKLGAIDGDIEAKWNPNNRNPEYPQSAQLRGINGTVALLLNIDGNGNVRNVAFQRKSGYPEIDLAIEKIARTWKINLSKNGTTVQGDVVLEYNFKLVGN